MCAAGDEIAVAQLRGVELAEPLRSVRVKQYAMLTADRSHLMPGLQGTAFVVRRHHGDEGGTLGSDELPQFVGCHHAGCIHRKLHHVSATRSFTHARVLNGGDHHEGVGWQRGKQGVV